MGKRRAEPQNLLEAGTRVNLVPGGPFRCSFPPGGRLDLRQPPVLGCCPGAGRTGSTRPGERAVCSYRRCGGKFQEFSSIARWHGGPLDGIQNYVYGYLLKAPCKQTIVCKLTDLRLKGNKDFCLPGLLVPRRPKISDNRLPRCLLSHFLLDNHK